MGLGGERESDPIGYRRNERREKERKEDREK